MKAIFTFVTRISEDFEEVTESATLSMEPYGDRGWIWTTDGWQSTGSTNEAGNGLWDGKQQVMGTSQFRLPSKPEKAIRKLVKRYIAARALPGSGRTIKLKITND